MSSLQNCVCPKFLFGEGIVSKPLGFVTLLCMLNTSSSHYNKLIGVLGSTAWQCTITMTRSLISFFLYLEILENMK